MNSEPKFWKQWTVIVAVLAAIAVIVVVVSFPQLYVAYAEKVWGPKFEKQLGFRAVTGQHETFGNTPVFYISEIAKGSPFERAGVKPGFIPVGYAHGFASGFYTQLESYRGKRTTLEFLEVSSSGKSVRHTIEIEVPE